MKEETRLRIAALLSTEPSFDMGLLAPLSEVCAGELSRRMRAGADPETECPEVYALALSLLIRAEGANPQGIQSPDSFTVGSVSISGPNTAEENSALRRRAYRLLRGYLQPVDFAFRGVRP